MDAAANGLIKDFAENYMEALFYFCLKKTSNSADAEDLTQDIALNILTALRKGTVPENFPAWVWQIARNRYAVWAKLKHNRSQSVTGFDVGDYEIENKNGNVLDEMIYSEELSLLRRELAFIKQDYRQILVAYYIEDKSVREIAQNLSLSESVVKQRLHRARKILKEGMDMAREFGRLSYKPENIAFFMNGLSGEFGEPWNYISRSLCKNILLAAYRTPSTAEELAIEVGVAMPYMEEELNGLVAATLMKKNSNKYETNFIIISAEAQKHIYAHLQSLVPSLLKVIIEALEFEIGWKDENCPGWHEGYQPLKDMKWTLFLNKIDTICRSMPEEVCELIRNMIPAEKLGPWGFTPRPNKGEWDIVGMETYDGDKPGFVGLSGCVSNPSEKNLPLIHFEQYNHKYWGSKGASYKNMTYAHGKALVSIANGHTDEADDAILKDLESYGYIKKTENGYIPTILVMRKEKTLKMPKEVLAQLTALHHKAGELYSRHYLFCRDQIYSEIPTFLREDTIQIETACQLISAVRGAILDEAVKQGYLTYDDPNHDRMLGAYLTL